jgi:Putative Flp pilus-assembly TadE/G-like
MSVLRLHWLSLRSNESGAVLVITAAFLVFVLAFLLTFVIDDSIWLVHRRHLQTEADAAVLAGAAGFQYPCTAGGSIDTGIATIVHHYDGTTAESGGLNEQVPKHAEKLESLINKSNLYGQSQPGDSGMTGSPCADSAIDVKLSEVNPTSYVQEHFREKSGPFGAIFGPEYITAQARVSIEKLASINGGLTPLAEPLPTPNAMTAYLIDEGNKNTVLATINLSATNGAKSSWAGTDPSFAFNATGPIGVQIAEGGGSPPVACENAKEHECFDTVDNIGITYTRVWSHPPATTPGQPATGTPAAPMADDVSFDPTTSTCPISGTFSNFISTSSGCTVFLKAANVRFAEGSGAPAITCTDASLTMKVGGGSTQTLSCPAGTPLNGQTWTSGSIAVSPNTGPTTITLGWTLEAGKTPSGAAGGTNGKCGDGKGNDPKPCTGTFGVVQRIFSGAYDSQTATSSHSGGVLAATLTNSSGSEIQSLQNSSTAIPVTVSVNVLSFQNSQSIGSSAIELSFGGNQANGLVSCPGETSAGNPQAEKAIAEGCQPPNNEFQLDTNYEEKPPCQTITTPPDCMLENSGNGKLDMVLDNAMNRRINGSKNAGCKSFNYWTSPNTNTIPELLNESPPDPRLLNIMTTDYGVFGNGRPPVPIRAIAAFYVTGWMGDPCVGHSNGVSTVEQTTGGTVSLDYTGDEEPSASANGGHPAGVLLGHFVQYIALSGGGTGSGECRQSTSLGNCIAVLTK